MAARLTAALYVAIVLLIMVMAVRNHGLVKDFWLRVITLAVAGGALGFIVLGNFLHAWENTILSIALWFFAGIAARAPELERSADYDTERLRILPPSRHRSLSARH